MEKKNEGIGKAILIQNKGKKVLCYDLTHNEKVSNSHKRKQPPCTEITLGGCYRNNLNIWSKRKKMEKASAVIRCQLCITAAYKNGPHQLCCTPCGHLFGYSCLRKWIVMTPECPECRRTCYTTQVRMLTGGSQLADCPEIAFGARGGGGWCSACFPRGHLV